MNACAVSYVHKVNLSKKIEVWTQQPIDSDTTQSNMCQHYAYEVH